MHTESCQKRIDKITESRAKFIAQYPNYCVKCGGAGIIGYSYDPSPSGVSLGSGSMHECEPCEYCVGHDQCPRCGEKLAWIDESMVGPDQCEYFKCYHCDWEENCEGIAQYDDCECYEIGLRGL